MALLDYYRVNRTTVVLFLSALSFMFAFLGPWILLMFILLTTFPGQTLVGVWLVIGFLILLAVYFRSAAAVSRRVLTTLYARGWPSPAQDGSWARELAIESDRPDGDGSSTATDRGG